MTDREKRDPSVGGEWPAIHPREGLEGIPENYERIARREKLVGALLAVLSAGVMLLILWAMAMWVGGR